MMTGWLVEVQNTETEEVVEARIVARTAAEAVEEFLRRLRLPDGVATEEDGGASGRDTQ